MRVYFSLLSLNVADFKPMTHFQPRGSCGLSKGIVRFEIHCTAILVLGYEKGRFKSEHNSKSGYATVTRKYAEKDF